MMTADDTEQGDASETNIAEPEGGKKKTAVVVVHGMGEQRPMDTLRSFVQTMWIGDRQIVDKRTKAIYSKPDEMTRSFELRRITTRYGNIKIDGADNEKRVDFYELYWAHLMTGNTLSGVIWWLVGLVVRPRKSVPDRLLGTWYVALTFFIIGAAFAILYFSPIKIFPKRYDETVKLVFALAGMLGTFVSGVFLKPVLGDAARYLTALPDNVEARQKIRQSAIDLLAALHACDEYDRIVVVGHSLGSVVALDALNYAWSQIPAKALEAAHTKGSAPMMQLDLLERAAGKLNKAKPADHGAAMVAFREAQRSYFRALRDHARVATTDGTRALWLVSDLITAGSPLCRADVLLARDGKEFEKKQELRELPTDPPTLEKQTPPRFSYPIRNPERIPHHAAVFAPTVWTNVYFTNRFLAFGDAISGEVRSLFGRGVRDVRIQNRWRFQHLDYWSYFKGFDVQPWLEAMRRAVNIRDRNEAELWGDQATSDEIIAERLSGGDQIA